MIRRQIIYKPTQTIELEYNYQYEVMKNIYYYISVADDVASRLLHNQGYRSDSGHIYKLFNFTLLFEGASFTQNSIVCDKFSTIKLIISGKEDIVDKVIKGVMHVKKVKIGNIEVPLSGVTPDKRVMFKPTMLYHAFSPIVESTLDDDGNVVYLTPFEGDYYKNLAINAQRKYKLIYNKDYTGDVFFDIDNALQIKEKYIKIKDGGVKGYEYDIWVQADIDMQKIIYYLGLGQNSSTGCGCLNYVTGVNSNG